MLSDIVQLSNFSVGACIGNFSKSALCKTHITTKIGFIQIVFLLTEYKIM